MRSRRSILIVLILFLCVAPFFAGSAPGREQAALPVGVFTGEQDAQGLPPGWQPLTFPRIPRHTRYSLVAANGGHAIRAESQGGASGLIRLLDLDPQGYPVLSWRWRVDQLVKGAEPGRREKDDFAARVYVIFAEDPMRAAEQLRGAGFLTGLFRRTLPMALTYVWCTRAIPGEIVPSPFSNRSALVVVRVGLDPLGKWIEERRNVLADYRAAFGEDPPRVSALAIMTDTDNTDEMALAYYADLRFLRAK